MLLTRKIYKNIISNIYITRIQDVSHNIEYKYISHNLKIYDISIYKEINRSIIINKLINIFINHINKFKGIIKNIDKIFKYNKIIENCQKWCWVQYNNPTIKDSIIPYVENEIYDFNEFIENFNYTLNENITLEHPIINNLILDIKLFLKKSFINFSNIKDINLNIDKIIDNDNIILKCNYNNIDYQISIHNNVYNRLINKLKVNSNIDDKYIFCLVFRYSYIDAENQQLAIHKKIKELFKIYNVNFELFGSAINVLSDYYCSLFYDIEKFFGSKGSFFDIELISGIYWCNPPYIDSIMTNVAHKIINLINTNKNIAFILTIPVWDKYTQNLKINNIKRNLNKNTVPNNHIDYPIYYLLKPYIKDELFIPRKRIPYFNYRHYKPIYASDTYMIIVYNNISNTNFHTVFSKIIELDKSNYFQFNN